jgi:hypothetical protein
MEAVMVNLNDTPSAGPLTAAELAAARKHSTGTVRPVPAGCGQNRWPERRVNWPGTTPTDFGSGYGDLHPVRAPRVIPCSTLSRLWLDAKDGHLSDTGLAVLGVAIIAALAVAAAFVAWLAGT